MTKVGIQQNPKNTQQLRDLVNKYFSKYRIDGDILNPAHILKIEDQVYKEFVRQNKEKKEYINN